MSLLYFRWTSALVLLSVTSAALANTAGHHRYRRNDEPASGNGCEESSPWPCKTPDHCLSFDFICDGTDDCPDKYDEDPALCTAKDRPAVDLLAGFIRLYHDWLVPNFLGAGKDRELALRLIESKTIEVYASKMNLTPEQASNLRELLLAVKNGQQIRLMLMGMPPEAWNVLYSLFKRIVETGFLGN